MQSRHVTLDADTVETVSISAEVEFIEVLVRTADAAVFFTVDGTDPEVAGNDTYVALGVGGLTVRIGAQSTVKMISSGTPDVSVSGYSDGDIPGGR